MNTQSYKKSGDMPASADAGIISLNDFDLSVALVSHGFKLVDMISERSGRKAFLFRNDLPIREFISDYWAGKATSNPLALANTRKNLKSRINAAW